MCGIAGVFGDPGVVDTNELVRMRDSLAHRGPDADGLYVSPDRRLGMAFRRLSIVDLTAASNQPLRSQDGRYAIVFNGEVFNYRTLRRDLEEHGYEFVTQGDAEVALYAYAEYGPECLRRFHGMFALAVWDETNGTLFLARDRFGIKPLYYYHDGRTFLFASELKALLVHRCVERAVDLQSFGDYLTYGYVPGERAMVRGVRKLLPAHWLRIRQGDLDTRCYWQLQYAPVDVADVVIHEELRTRMHDAVGLWMVSDVEVGAFLSGGLDSSSVCTLATRHSDTPLRTFSIGFDDARQDETAYAKLVADAIGAHHTKRQVTLTDARATVALQAAAYDEPLVDTSCVPTLAVSALASESVRVVLTGDGADEVFLGYGWHRQLLTWRERPRVASFDGAARWLIEGSRGLPGLARITVLEALTTSDVVRRYFLLRGFFDQWEKRQLLGAQARDSDDDLWYLRRHFDPNMPLDASLRMLDIHTYLADDILPKVDRASMAYSLEARTPLLEHTLAEFAMTIPERLVCAQGELKATMKAAMKDLLPPSIVTRRKRGFSSPIVKWFQSGFAAEAMERTCHGYAAADGLIDPAYIRRMVSGYTKRRWYKLWQLLVFEEWYRQWIRGIPLAESHENRKVPALIA